MKLLDPFPKRPKYIRTDAESRFITESGKQFEGDSPQANERTPEEYEQFLKIDTTRLSGKNVLNIGAGITGIFEKNAVKKGADVITMSPYFSTWGGQFMKQKYQLPIHARVMRTLGKTVKHPHVLAGVAEDIPLDDSSVDLVLALYSVPLYSHDISAMMSEILRVLMNEGEARLYPVNEENRAKIESALNGVKGCSFEFENIQENSGGVYHGDPNVYLLKLKKM